MWKRLADRASRTLITTAMIIIMVGCNSDQGDRVTDSRNISALSGWTETDQEVIFQDESRGDRILEHSMLFDDIAWGRVWLEDQGYTYVASNSLVLIERELAYVPIERETENRSRVDKVIPGHNWISKVARADTVVWLAFENPTHDSTNHTALLAHWQNDDSVETVLVELNVSAEVPAGLREGHITGGAFVSDDLV